MTKRVIAAVGALSAAALGAWLSSKRQHRLASRAIDLDSAPSIANDSQKVFSIEIDDDAAAEIISRARPALERAARVH
jgi:hypothetical protein